MIRRFAVAIVVGLIFSAQAFAVCLKPRPKTCAEFFRSDAVFVGTVLSQRSVPNRGEEITGWVYQVIVKQRLRGSLPNTVEVFTANSTDRFPLELGKEYLLFAHAEADGRLTVTSCGNSGLSKVKNAEIQAIQKLPQEAAASIEVHVGKSGSGAIEGIEFRIRRVGFTTYATSDHGGWIHLAVPAATYSVETSASGITPYALSFDDPERLVLQRGQCAEVEFTGR